MAAGGRGAVAEEVAGRHLFQVGDGVAQAVCGDAALFRVALAFDIPELKQVEEVGEGHAIEVVQVEALLDIAQLHGPHKRLEREAAAVAATRAVRVGFGDDHAPVPEVLRDAVVNVVFTRCPTTMVGVGAVQGVSGDDFQHVRVEAAVSVILHQIFAGIGFGQRLVHGGEAALVHRVRPRGVVEAFSGLGRLVGCSARGRGR